MDNTQQYITVEKREELENELVALKGPKRKQILESLEFAKSLGDLSENAEYHQAREEQAKLEERIGTIEEVLRNSEVVKAHSSTQVEVGTTVIVQKEGTKEQKKYQIVGSEEADMQNGKISHQSPLGVALFSKKKGDTVSFNSPKGAVQYKIIDIE